MNMRHEGCEQTVNTREDGLQSDMRLLESFHTQPVNGHIYVPLVGNMQNISLVMIQTCFAIMRAYSELPVSAMTPASCSNIASWLSCLWFNIQGLSYSHLGTKQQLGTWFEHVCGCIAYNSSVACRPLSRKTFKYTWHDLCFWMRITL